MTADAPVQGADARTAAGETIAALWRAIADDLADLARLHDREPDADLLRALRAVEFPQRLGLRLESDRARDALRAMCAAMAAIGEPVDDALLDRLAADYADIYLTGSLHAPPCESPWLDDDGLVCQAAMFAVRACYHGRGLAVADWRKRSDDHLVHELLFASHLCAGADDPEALRAAARFLDDHLLRWIGRFAARVAHRCDTPFFAALALLTEAYVEELRDLLAGHLGEARPAAEDIARGAGAPGAPPAAPGTGPSW